MQPLDYYVAASLDGFIARTTGAHDFFIADGPHVADYLTALGAFDAAVMGRKTYEVGTQHGVTDPYPHLRTYVVSRSLSDSTDANVTIVRDDVPAFVRALEARDGRSIYLCGGAELAGQLIAEGLVAFVNVKLNPVLIGAGISLVAELPRATPRALVDHTICDDSVVVLRYRLVREAVG